MNAKFLLVSLLLLWHSLLSLAHGDCEFLRPPPSMKRVSNNPSTPFRIRFTLKPFSGYCFMRAQIPSGAVVGFNLTRRLDGEKHNHGGDNLSRQIYVTSNLKTLMVVSVGEEFGSRFGKYLLNERDVYGVPYHESVYRPVLGGSCVRDGIEEGGFELSGRIRTSPTFRRCLQWNKKNGKKEEDYLFCPNCKTEPALSEDGGELSFALEAVNESEQFVACQIRSEDDRVNYMLRFVPSCQRSSSRSGDSK